MAQRRMVARRRVLVVVLACVFASALAGDVPVAAGDGIAAAGPACGQSFPDERDAQRGLDVRRSTLKLRGKNVEVTLQTFNQWPDSLLRFDQARGTGGVIGVAFDNRDGSYERGAFIYFDRGRLRGGVGDPQDPSSVMPFKVMRPDRKSVRFRVPLKEVRPPRGGFYWGAVTGVIHGPNDGTFDMVPSSPRAPEHHNGFRYKFQVGDGSQSKTIGVDAVFGPPGASTSPDEPAAMDLSRLTVGRESGSLTVEIALRELGSEGFPPQSGIATHLDVGSRSFVLEATTVSAAGVIDATLFELKKGELVEIRTFEGTIDPERRSVSVNIPLSLLVRGSWAGAIVSGGSPKGTPDVDSYLEGVQRTSIDGIETDDDLVLC